MMNKEELKLYIELLNYLLSTGYSHNVISARKFKKYIPIKDILEKKTPGIGIIKNYDPFKSCEKIEINIPISLQGCTIKNGQEISYTLVLNSSLAKEKFSPKYKKRNKIISQAMNSIFEM